MGHVYDKEFFDYIDTESCVSATRLISLSLPWLKPRSVLDVGCGRGAWLRHWLLEGVEDVFGVDGDFIDRSELHFDVSRFQPHDLELPLDLGRRFDLVQSLEVAEHLSPSTSEDFVKSLTLHGDIVLFSAAVPGQGGEHHVNERPLSYWRDLFGNQGYRCFDCIRSAILTESAIRPWYRYNSLLYVNEIAVADLPSNIRATEVPPNAPIADLAPLSWRLRRWGVGLLPRRTVTGIAQFNARRKAERFVNR